jgi:6-methylsalicylate decarboxylase
MTTFVCRADVHAHYNPPEYFAELDRIGAIGDLTILRALGHLWLPSARADTARPAARAEGTGAAALDRRLAAMDAAGVDKQWISIGAVQPYVRDADDATALAGMLNDAYREVVDVAAGRLGAFGTLPLPHVDRSVSAVAHVMDDLGFDGVALGASAQGVPIDDERFAPVWHALDERRAIVYLHPGASIVGVPGAVDFHLAPDFVSPAETAICLARLICAGVVERFPRVRIVAAALGGSVPFLARRFDHGLAQDAPEVLERLGGSVLPWFRRFWYDTSVTEEPGALRDAVALFGADRIVLGSDYARPGASMIAAVDFVARSPYLDEEQKRLILDVTATSSLGLS